MRTLVCLLSLASMALPQQLTRDERDRAMSELHATRKQFLDAVAGLSAAQWSFKPSEKAWSVAEIAEHLAVAEEFLIDKVTQEILSSPAAPEKTSEVKGKDEAVLAAGQDRGAKYQAPAALQPARRFTPEAAVERFRASRARVIAYVEATTDDLRSHFAPHPAAGLLDAYQWILFASAHTARHVEQIREVRAHPRFPTR